MIKPRMSGHMQIHCVVIVRSGCGCVNQMSVRDVY